MEMVQRSGDELAYSISRVVELTGICDTLVRDAIREGRLKARYMGRKPLVMKGDLEAFLASLPDTAPHRRKNAAAA